MPHAHRIKGLFRNLGEAGCTIRGNKCGLHVNSLPILFTIACKLLPLDMPLKNTSYKQIPEPSASTYLPCIYVLAPAAIVKVVHETRLKHCLPSGSDGVAGALVDIP
eukprot:1152077-Pelagomonas_calceolata.AAC.1